MKKIAITGTIGSGKTACTTILSKMGYVVFSCDAEVAKMYEKNHPIGLKIAKLLGKETVDKKEVSYYFFEDKEFKEAVEKLIHEEIHQKMFQFFEENKKEKVVFVEVPLLYEVGWESIFDFVVVITCDEEIARKRLKKYRNITEEEAKKRMQHQWSTEKKIECADKILYNNGELDELEHEIIVWLEEWGIAG